MMEPTLRSNMTKQPKWHGLIWILCTFVQLAMAYEIIHECNDGHGCHESTIYGMVDEANPEMQMIINCSTPGSCTSLTVYSSVTTVVHCSGLLSCQNAEFYFGDIFEYLPEDVSEAYPQQNWFP